MVDVARARAGLVPGRAPAPAPARETVTARQVDAPFDIDNSGPAEVNISNVSAPAEQPPGVEVNVTISLKGTFITLGILDPDRCSTGFGGSIGLSTRVAMFVNGSFAGQDTVCVPSNGTSTTLSFTAPNREGPVDVRIEAETAEQGAFAASATGTVQISEAAEEDEDDDGNGGGGPFLPCFVDPNRSCDRVEGLAWAAVVILGGVTLLGD